MICRHVCLKVSIRQGDLISPSTFIFSYLERVMDTIKENGTAGILLHGYNINNLKFADNIDLLEEGRGELQENLKRLNESGEASGLKINIKKNHDNGVLPGEHHRGIDDHEVKM